MNANTVDHMPPGTRAAILRAVIAEKHPKMALAPIAARYGVTYDVVRVIIDKAGYPDPAKMRIAAADLEQQETLADHAADVARQTLDQLSDTHDDAGDQLAEEKSGGDSGTGTYDGPRSDVEPPATPEAGRLTVVRVADLHPDPDNLRPVQQLHDDDIVDLADSIATNGLLQPIVARRDPTVGLVVVMGHRRLAAIQRLKWTSVDAIVRGPMTEDEVLAAMLIENGQRKDLDPISEARGLRRLQQVMGDEDGPATEAEIARRIGRSGVFVRSRILLLSLDADSQERVRRGELTIGAAGHVASTATGRTGHRGVDRNWHLGPRHDLAGPARRRCESQRHGTGRKIGGVACGECWESVIVAKARAEFVDHAHRTGTCPVCDHTVQPEEALA